MQKNNEFKKLVGILLNEHKQTINNISNKLLMDEKEFYKYYSGYEEETPEIIEKLNTYIKSLKKITNEFKELADQIAEKHKMAHREMARRIGITEVSFSRYYDGVRGATDEEMQKLKKLYENKEFETVKYVFNRFKVLVDILTNKYKVSKKEIMSELRIDDMSFISYYSGDKEATNEILNQLYKFEREQKEKEQENNEFRRLVNIIGKKHEIIHREMARKIGISEVSFLRYYDGAIEAPYEVMNKLNDLYTNMNTENTKKDANEFKKLVDSLVCKYNMILREVARELELTDIDFHLYYEGHKEVEPEIIKKLYKFMDLKSKKTKGTNEFKILVDSLGYTYQRIKDELNISDDLFNAYYKGFKIADSKVIEKLQELKNKRCNNGYEFAEIIHRLSKLNTEHKKEVYDLINSYSEEENKIKNLIPNNKD